MGDECGGGMDDWVSDIDEGWEKWIGWESGYGPGKWGRTVPLSTMRLSHFKVALE